MILQVYERRHEVLFRQGLSSDNVLEVAAECSKASSHQTLVFLSLYVFCPALRQNRIDLVVQILQHKFSLAGSVSHVCRLDILHL